MNVLAYLIPVSLVMGLIGLAAFFWSLRNGQYEDLAGDAERILFDNDDKPLAARSTSQVWPDEKEPKP
ncbi:cbb3-type cytochrome oxidase assembly protein CcoS [uncultured Paracoccus sp.]|uniref:cbb3-type cytochrome oxidase assembly protein CcoS n=1 Tax=uncultured Paracoccus sp. TaxID=189685 RepID=UPI00261112AE|nr:cbb3-type cytochrome oxidase assembly protein CcoS [uncultured Paracoccus sp.]